MSVGQPQVLILEDDQDIRALLALHLGREGYRITENDGRTPVEEILQGPRPQLVVLDWMLPQLPGIEILRRFRSTPAWKSIPVLMLTARVSEADIVRGLEAGADDYVTKPFSIAVVMARVHALLRRATHIPPETATEANRVTVGPLEIDSGRFEAKLDGKLMTLTESEFRVLEALSRRPGIVMTRNQLVERIRGPGFSVTDRTIDNFVLSLRKKLGPSEGMIQTVRGVGYRLEAG